MADTTTRERYRLARSRYEQAMTTGLNLRGLKQSDLDDIKRLQQPSHVAVLEDFGCILRIQSGVFGVKQGKPSSAGHCINCGAPRPRASSLCCDYCGSP